MSVHIQSYLGTPVHVNKIDFGEKCVQTMVNHIKKHGFIIPVNAICELYLRYFPAPESLSLDLN